MSIDVFFQPLDLKMWEVRLFPYLRGHGDLDDLFAEAKRLQRLRSLVSGARRAVIPYERDPSYPDWYDHDLTILFRPFFLVGNDPDESARLIAAYQKATEKEAMELVREQVRRIAPDRADRVKRPKGVKAEAETIRSLAHDLKKLRDACGKLVKDDDKDVDDLDGAYYEAAEMYNGEIYSDLLRLNEEIQPTWHIRAWFMDYLLDEFGVAGWRDLAEPTQRLYDPLFDTLPAGAHELFTEPSDLGFAVRPKNVPKLREKLAARVKKVGIDLKNDGDNQQRALSCLLEALTYAQQQKLALTERIC